MGHPTDIDDLFLDDFAPVATAAAPFIDEVELQRIQTAPSERPPMLKRTSEQIGETLKEIQEGTASGEHPALDRLIGPEARHPNWPGDHCPPNCKHRTERPFITDVFPSLPERVYGLESDMRHLRSEVKEHREDGIRASGDYVSRDKFDDLVKSTDARFGSIGSKLDRRTAFQVLQTCALIASFAYAIILSYKHFISPN
jgi:hypothetical protein